MQLYENSIREKKDTVVSDFLNFAERWTFENSNSLLVVLW